MSMPLPEDVAWIDGVDLSEDRCTVLLWYTNNDGSTGVATRRVGEFLQRRLTVSTQPGESAVYRPLLH